MHRGREKCVNNYNCVSVSEVNEYIKNILSADENLTGLFIRGEISNFKHHLKSGHLYFTLKDEKTSLKAVMFRSNAQRLNFHPNDGMKVIVFGSIRAFERDGVYQLYCEDVQPDGVGALYLAFEQLKKKLGAKGYFDPERKRPIKQLPETLAVITAETGAALQDILNIITRRYPLVNIKLLPVLVQGETAPKSIANAFAFIQKQGAGFADTVILARGGGSLEDLSAFNTELVAEAIYRCPIPVISAIGHEVDFTIADFVADLRAPTPSAAAELAVPNRTDLYNVLDNTQNILYNYTLKAVNDRVVQLHQLSGQLLTFSPEKQLQGKRFLLERASQKLSYCINTQLKQAKGSFVSLAGMLEALSPLQVLTRGYSITFADGIPVRDAGQVNKGQIIETKLEKGSLISEVVEING